MLDAKHLEYFESYIMPEPMSGCWLWIGALRGSYGIFRPTPDRKESAHRLSYKQWRGPIPEGLVIDHICRQRVCVNPDHLRVVTKRQNTLENSDSLQAKNAVKTHCKRG